MPLRIISSNPFGSDPVRLDPTHNIVGVAWGGKSTWLCLNARVNYDPNAGAFDPSMYQPFTIQITDVIASGAHMSVSSNLGFSVPLDWAGVEPGGVTAILNAYTSNPSYPENPDDTLIPLNKAQTTTAHLIWYLARSQQVNASPTDAYNYAGVMFNIDYLKVLGVTTLTLKGHIDGIFGNANFFADVCQATTAELAAAASDPTEFYSYMFPYAGDTVSHYFQEAIGSFGSPYGVSRDWQLDMDLATRKFTGNGGLGAGGLFGFKYQNDFTTYDPITA